MNIASYIEHTNLKPEATIGDISRLCDEAMKYNFAAVCVNSAFVSPVHAMLKGSDVRISCVVGFPLGAMATKIKGAEAAYAIAAGADEIDMVLAVGKVKSGDWEYVFDDIHQVVTAASGHPVKVILETGLLTDDEKKQACTTAVQAGAAYVKTSTGFGHGGATVADVQLMRAAVGNKARIKASGGIRDYATACKMIAAGADRLGTSSGVALVKDEHNDGK
jgi:deoxyribose-phosphate aldolase